MKLFRKIPLHTQIIIALILGAFFGAMFAVDPYMIKINYGERNEEKKDRIENWDKFIFAFPDIEISPRDTKVIEYGSMDQIQIIKFFKELNAKQRQLLTIRIIIDDELSEYSNITSLAKENTVATEIKPLGTLFIRLLSFLAIPLVIASLIVGAASLDDVKKIGRIGGRTLFIYITTTAIAITIGLTAANVIKPGKQINEQTKQRLIGEFQEDTPSEMIEELDIDIPDFIVSIVPKNPMNAIAEGRMLQIVFFAVIFGITLTYVKKKNVVLDFFDGVSDTMIKMVDFIMKIAPLGVFALIAATIAEFGFEIIMTLIWYIFAVVLGLLLHTVFVYSILVKGFGKMSPLVFFKGIRNAQAIGFSTSSSAATLPVTFDCVERNLGINKTVSGFVLPLGATINMDGTALYQGVAAVFIAQVYGFDLTIAEQLTVVLTAVLASIGTAPVPGVGIIMLVMILQAIHVPPEGIALIIGVDRLLDMCRTITNVSGDSAVAVAIAGMEKR
jgi:proton glutamate symport protein